MYVSRSMHEIYGRPRMHIEITAEHYGWPSERTTLELHISATKIDLKLIFCTDFSLIIPYKILQ